MSEAASPERRLWLFNLDAELELERDGRPYQTAAPLARALAPLRDEAQRLMAPEDESLDPDATPTPRRGRWLGRCWCPTPSALRRLTRAGARLEPSPRFEILRRVNHRRFYLELGGGAPGARFVEDALELELTLAAPAAAWLFKKPFGFAGRGQRRISGVPSRDDRRWLEDGLRQGGLLAEPWLELEREVGIHGFIDGLGRLALGQVCIQETNRFRAWVSTRRAAPDEIAPEHVSALASRAEGVAAALWQAGYFGPFGIDAYLYRTGSGRIELNSLGELNARFSMGYAAGNPRAPDEATPIRARPSAAD